MTTEDFYEKHLDTMFSTDIETCAENDIETIFSRLIHCLPNDGKLYKYRSIEGNAFSCALDSLKNNYIWMAKASSLNDDFDCVIRFDPIKEVERTRQMFLAEPWHYLIQWIKINEDKKYFVSPIEKYRFKRVVECVDCATWQIDDGKAIDLLVESGITRTEAKKYLSNMLLWIKKTIDVNAEKLRQPISNLIDFNKNNRENIYVFSMAEEYNSNAMWGLYANSNHGFCIEYDFKRALSMPCNIKRKLSSLFKVVYVEEFKEFSFDKLDRCLFSDFNDKALLKELNKEYINYLLSKDKDWDKEKEWRLMLFGLKDNHLYVDLVSGIIIDERVIHTNNAVKLIQLAKERGWSIKVRKMNAIGTQHLYENYVA